MIQYAITDRGIFGGHERQQRQALLSQARGLAAAGVDFLQLREKDLPPADLLALAAALRTLLPPGRLPRLLINSDLPAALATHADGLHLPSGHSPVTLADAREAFRNASLPSPTLSVSAHTLADVQAARGSGANLILFGPVFEKRVHGIPIQLGVGLISLAAAVRAAHPIPVLALGGVTRSSIPQVLATGAAGVAAIRLFLPDAEAATPEPDRA